MGITANVVRKSYVMGSQLIIVMISSTYSARTHYTTDKGENKLLAFVLWISISYVSSGWFENRSDPDAFL